MAEQQQPNEISILPDDSHSNENEDPADYRLQNGVPSQEVLDLWKSVGHGLETKGTGESFGFLS
jgi:hypothetical protein